MAFVWWLLLFGMQIVIGIVAAVIIVAIIAAQHGPEYLQDLINKSGPNAIFQAPGATTLIFFAATGGTLLVAVAVAYILFRRNTRRAMAMRGLNWIHFVMILFLVMPTQIVAAQVMTWANRVLPHMTGNQDLYEQLSQQWWVLILIGGCILPAMGEELFFRGFLSRGLVARHGVFLGTILASFLFGLMHLDPPQVCGTMAMALMLQVVFLSTKSLSGSILLHGLNNALAFALMKLAQSKATQATIIVDDDKLPITLFIAGLIVLLAMGRLLYETRAQWVLPDGQIWSPGYVTAEIPPAHLEAVPQLTRPRMAAVAAAVLANVVFFCVLAWEIYKTSSAEKS
jgi:membrane protease YdiL (CAAX protease family)